MNAIITAATGYQNLELEPFVRSVAKSCEETQLFIIAHQSNARNLQILKGQYPLIRPVYVGHKVSRGRKLFGWFAQYFAGRDLDEAGAIRLSIGRYSLHIMLERFFIANDILRANCDVFANWMLSDCRDVIVQRDPFKKDVSDFVCGLEERVIGECPYNSRWIAHLYGENILENMKDKRIVCAGVTLGTTLQIQNYLRVMCGEIWRCLPKIVMSGSYDQGIHNYLIHTGRVKPTLTENRCGIIATLQHENWRNIDINKMTGDVHVANTIPAIIHQYDRHESLAAHVRQNVAKNCVAFDRAPI